MKAILSSFQGLVLAICSLVVSSCTHYYAPTQHNVPLFSSKGETRITVAESAGTSYVGFNLQGAYALSAHAALMTDVMWYTIEGFSSNLGRGTYFDAGAGYFNPISKHWTIETYGGLGFGGGTNDDPANYYKVNYQKFFIQPDIGYRSRAFEVAFSLRMAGLNFSRVETGPSTSQYLPDLDPSVSQLQFLVEPALTLRAGWDYIKLQLQVGLTENTSYPELSDESVGMGLLITIPPLNHKNHK